MASEQEPSGSFLTGAAGFGGLCCGLPLLLGSRIAIARGWRDVRPWAARGRRRCCRRVGLASPTRGRRRSAEVEEGAGVGSRVQRGGDVWRKVATLWALRGQDDVDVVAGLEPHGRAPGRPEDEHVTIAGCVDDTS